MVQKLSISIILLVIGTMITPHSFTTHKRGSDHPNVVLVIIDTLRPDHLSAYGYDRQTSPNLDALANNGALFLNAYSHASWTKPAITSILTSKTPDVHQVKHKNSYLPETLLTIPDYLNQAGYYTYYMNEGNGFVDKDFGFGYEYDEYHKYFYNLEESHQVSEKIAYDLKGLPKPFFIYAHYMTPHLPYAKHEYTYAFTPEERPYFDGVDQIRQANFSDAEKQYYRDLYDGQIKYVDEAIGILVNGLIDQGLWDNTILMITSDHGEEFWDHGNFEHGHSLYNELVHVPLIIAGNEIAEQVIESRVRHIDLLPTILDYVDIKQPKDLQGISLRSELDDQVFLGYKDVLLNGILYGGEKYGYIQGDHKLIMNVPTQNALDIQAIQAATFELSKIQKDGSEIINHDDEAKEQKLKSKLFKALDKNKLVQSAGEQVEINEEMQEQLKSLGYL